MRDLDLLESVVIGLFLSLLIGYAICYAIAPDPMKHNLGNSFLCAN